MNPRYGQMLKTLKVADFEEIPPFEKDLMAMVKEDINNYQQKALEGKGQTGRLRKQLEPIKNNHQLMSLPENIEKQDLLNFAIGSQSIYFDSVYRVKRFLLIYSNQRLNKIEDHYWYYSGSLTEKNRANLSETEKQYLNNYKTLASQYMNAAGLDLTSDIDPPVDPSVQVLFLKDCGEILSDQGLPIKLEKNAAMYIKRRLIENFIKDGSAQIMCSNPN